MIGTDGGHGDLSKRDLSARCTESGIVMILQLRSGEVALSCGEQVMRYGDLAETPLRLRGDRAKEGTASRGIDADGDISCSH